MRIRRSHLMVDGVVAWVSCAGAPASAARDDIDTDVVIKSPPKIQLSLTEHEFVVEESCWRCSKCGRYAATEHSKHKLFSQPCIPRPVSSAPRSCDTSGVKRPAAAAGI
eukprot:3324621-Pyramimonas_sp.AAC.1